MKVQEIIDWLSQKTCVAHSNSDSDSLSKLAQGAPEGITKENVQEAFIQLQPYDISVRDHDIRGFFITALADKVCERKGTIILTHPEMDKFRTLGFCWRKGTLILNGNAGSDVGYCMEGGHVVVKGNVKENAGIFMTGGQLTIHGNTRYNLGCAMKGGCIYVKGNCGPDVGSDMTRGKIVVEGKILRIPDAYGHREPYIGAETITVKGGIETEAEKQTREEKEQEQRTIKNYQEKKELVLELYKEADRFLQRHRRVEIGEYIHDVSGALSRLSRDYYGYFGSRAPENFRGSFSPTVIERKGKNLIDLDLIGYAENASSVELLIDSEGNVRLAKSLSQALCYISSEQFQEIIRVLQSNPQSAPC